MVQPKDQEEGKEPAAKDTVVRAKRAQPFYIYIEFSDAATNREVVRNDSVVGEALPIAGFYHLKEIMVNYYDKKKKKTIPYAAKVLMAHGMFRTTHLKLYSFDVIFFLCVMKASKPMLVATLTSDLSHGDDLQSGEMASPNRKRAVKNPLKESGDYLVDDDEDTEDLPLKKRRDEAIKKKKVRYMLIII